jgi:hypothetical protein
MATSAQCPLTEPELYELLWSQTLLPHDLAMWSKHMKQPTYLDAIEKGLREALATVRELQARRLP